MRTMVNQNTNQRLKVVEHFITQNSWEYFVCEAHTNRGTVYLCLVLGDYNEIGDVDMEEVNRYVVSKTTNLREVEPAEGWVWE